LITESDNDLIEFGDDFGFSGSFSWILQVKNSIH
jgi:hypothetical protein